MTRNRVSLQLSAAQLAALDAALDTIESVLADLVSLTPWERRHLTKMGERSEVFCRQTLRVLRQNPRCVPPRLDLAGAMRDLAAVDALRPRMHRLARLTERTQDTDKALRADVMDAAMEGHAVLKITGEAMGLDGLRREIGVRFARGKRRRDAAEDAAEVPEIADVAAEGP